MLGAKPLQPDGTAFYYSDYSNDGHKGYSNHHWPCCSGTLPQVAADYRLNSYLHDAQNLYVNMYVPSTLRWDRGGNIIQLQQVTEYPFAEVVRFELTASRAADFSIYLRIPAWSDGASVSVNGKPVSTHIRPGQYFPLQRQWKSGDRIELRLPMTTRTEAIDPQHPNIVALMYGPLVLFPVSNRPKPLARQQLLSAKRDGAKAWQLQTSGGAIRFLPFTELTDEPYSTYVTVT